MPSPSSTISTTSPAVSDGEVSEISARRWFGARRCTRSERRSPPHVRRRFEVSLACTTKETSRPAVFPRASSPGPNAVHLRAHVSAWKLKLHTFTVKGAPSMETRTMTSPAPPLGAYPSKVSLKKKLKAMVAMVRESGMPKWTPRSIKTLSKIDPKTHAQFELILALLFGRFW